MLFQRNDECFYISDKMNPNVVHIGMQKKLFFQTTVTYGLRLIFIRRRSSAIKDSLMYTHVFHDDCYSIADDSLSLDSTGIFGFPYDFDLR